MDPAFFWQTVARLDGIIITLNLSFADGLTDLGPLAGLTNLQDLDLSGAGGVTDLSPLAGLTSLQKLNLIDTDGVTRSEIEKLQVARPDLHVLF